MPEARKVYARRLDIRHGQVELAHGSGGRAMAQLIDELFARHLGNEYLAQGDDGALLPGPGAGRAMSSQRRYTSMLLLVSTKMSPY